MANQFVLASGEAEMLKDFIYHYRETFRLGGDELALLQRVSVFLGATEEEAAKISA